MIQIRPLIFETNSSSVHCLVVLTSSEYNAWKNGEAFIDYYASGEERRPKVCTLEEVFSYEYVDEEYEILTVKVDDKVVVSIEGYDG